MLAFPTAMVGRKRAHKLAKLLPSILDRPGQVRHNLGMTNSPKGTTDMTTTLALITFFLIAPDGTKNQVEALRICYTDQDRAHEVAHRHLQVILEAHPNTLGTWTLTWP